MQFLNRKFSLEASKRVRWENIFLFFTYILLDLRKSKYSQKIDQKNKVVISKNHNCRFVGNVYADLGLPWFSHRTRFDASGVEFRFKNRAFLSKYDKNHFFNKMADMADFHEEMLVKVVLRVFCLKSII